MIQKDVVGLVEIPLVVFTLWSLVHGLTLLDELLSSIIRHYCFIGDRV